MGILSWLFGGGVAAVAGGVKEVAEVFRPNAEKEAARQSGEFGAVLAEFGREFRERRHGWFDGLVDGLNRLPRPALALGCLGLFAYAMADPAGFSVRMQGLGLVPEPLWWLLGAIVSFYFGARELHYLREKRDTGVDPVAVAETLRAVRDIRALAPRAPGQPEAVRAAAEAAAAPAEAAAADPPDPAAPAPRAPAAAPAPAAMAPVQENAALAAFRTRPR